MVKSLERFQHLQAEQINLTNTVWRDMVMDLFGRRLNSTSGGVDYDYDENVINFGSGGDIDASADRVGGNQEINHDFKIGNVTFIPHIHWFQAASTKFELTIRYRHQKNGAAKTTNWTTLQLIANDGQDVFTYGSGILNQITSTKSNIILTNIGLSDTIQIQMARTDSLGGTMPVYFFDLHGEIDTIGSKQEYIK